MHLISYCPLLRVISVTVTPWAFGEGRQEVLVCEGAWQSDASRRQRLGVLGGEPELRVDRLLDLREGNGHVPFTRVDSRDPSAARDFVFLAV